MTLNYKPRLRIMFVVIFCLFFLGLAKSLQAATVTVVDQDDPSGLTPSCDNNVQAPELAPALTAPNWIAGAGWSVSGGQITFSGTNTATIYPSIPISVQSGKRYRVSITANTTPGATITGSLGGTALTNITYTWASAYTFTSDLTAQNTNNLVLSGDNGEGVTITAITVKRLHDDVQAAVNSANNGDTVSVATGSCTWDTAINLTKQIKLIGTGNSGSTWFTNITCPSGTCIQARSGNVDNMRISGFKFIGTFGNCDLIQLGGGVDWRVDHNWLYNSQWGYGISAVGTVSGVFPRGLVDHNRFDNIKVIAEGADLWASSYWNLPDILWAQGPSNGNALGDQNAVYIEDNETYTNVFNDVFDANSAGRLVYRFNRLISNGAGGNEGMFMMVHSKMGGAVRGTQRWEIYNNYDDNQGGNIYVPADLRAGTGVAFNNTIKSSNNPPHGSWTDYVLELLNIRSVNPDCSNEGMGCCNGTDPRDQLVPPYACRDQIGYGYDTTYWCNGTYTGNNPEGGTCSSMGAWNQVRMPVYGWNNGPQDKCYNPSASGSACDNSLLFAERGDNINPPVIVANRDFYNYVSPFTGASGVGVGTLANRPSNCTTGVAYWATDQGSWNHSSSGGQGVLYKCTATNNWTLYYTPYTYPHPLQGNIDNEPPAAPTGLAVQ